MQSSATAHLRLGDIAPDFEAETTWGPIRFHEWLGQSWCVFFSHPKDFTPVCTTELGYAARVTSEFDKRGVKTIALSVSSLDDHQKWKKDIDETQNCQVAFPMIADPNKAIANLYGMIHPQASDTATVRSVFIIDPNKKIRLMMIYPASTGRNFEEVLRVLDSMQLTDKHKVATPVNWAKGEDCIILPSITDPKELAERFPKGFKEVKPYLRITPQP
ncbi:MAG: peroxiredoxin [Chlamydiales bacterium]|nr:peroxiredoxin [Chlamydiales bacterium]